MGIDIGTSACKVAVFGSGGNVLAQANQAYEVYYPKQGWAEQDADQWWQAICLAIQKVLGADGVSAADICAIGVDGQGGPPFRWIKKVRYWTGHQSGWIPERGISVRTSRKNSEQRRYFRWQATNFYHPTQHRKCFGLRKRDRRFLQRHTNFYRATVTSSTGLQA